MSSNFVHLWVSSISISSLESSSPRLGMSQHVAREILTEILIGNHERFPCNLRLYSDMDVGIFVDILRSGVSVPDRVV